MKVEIREYQYQTITKGTITKGMTGDLTTDCVDYRVVLTSDNREFVARLDKDPGPTYSRSTRYAEAVRYARGLAETVDAPTEIPVRRFKEKVVTIKEWEEETDPAETLRQ